MVSLVGCIVPRLFVYWRGLRAEPPAAPRNLTRLPGPRVVHHRRGRRTSCCERARRAAAAQRRYRRASDGADGVRSAPSGATCARPATCSSTSSVLVVLVGFAIGSLFGYKGGVILVRRQRLLQHPDPVRRLRARQPVRRRRHGAVLLHRRRLRRGVADDRAAAGHGPRLRRRTLTYRDVTPGRGRRRSLRPQVNHPLTIGGTEVFLIGHGYAPVITVRDGDGNIAYDGPDGLPARERPDLRVVRRGQGARRRSPTQHRARGLFYPTVRAASTADRGQPSIGDDAQPAAVAARLHRRPRPRHRRRRSRSTRSTRPGDDAAEEAGRRSCSGSTCSPGQTVAAARRRGLGDLRRRQALDTGSRSAGRPASGSRCSAWCSRWSGCWARCSSGRGGSGSGRAATATGRTLVEVAALDRSGGGDLTAVLSSVADSLQAPAGSPSRRTTKEHAVTDAAVGDAEQPGDRGRRRSSTSWRCWPTWSSGRAAHRAGRRGRRRRARRRRRAPRPAAARPPTARRRPPTRRRPTAIGDVRPARPAAHGRRLRRPLRGPGRARHGRGPATGCRGATCTSSRSAGTFVVVARLPAAAPALRAGLDGRRSSSASCSCC